MDPQIRYLMLEACGVLEDLGRGAGSLADLLQIRAGLASAAEATEDREAADGACGMIQAIDEVLERVRTAAAAAA